MRGVPPLAGPPPSPGRHGTPVAGQHPVTASNAAPAQKRRSLDRAIGTLSGRRASQRSRWRLLRRPDPRSRPATPGAAAAAPSVPAHPRRVTPRGVDQHDPSRPASDDHRDGHPPHRTGDVGCQPSRTASHGRAHRCRHPRQPAGRRICPRRPAQCGCPWVGRCALPGRHLAALRLRPGPGRRLPVGGPSGARRDGGCVLRQGTHRRASTPTWAELSSRPAWASGG